MLIISESRLDLGALALAHSLNDLIRGHIGGQLIELILDMQQLRVLLEYVLD